MGKNMLIGQSGGPTAAINATLSGVILEGIRHSEIDGIFGAINGIQGILNKRIIELQSQIKTDEQFKMLECTPAMALGSCRYKLPAFDENPDLYEDILNTFHEYGIGFFFYIGGNDSMDTVRKLSDFFQSKGEDIKCIGVPKTIDNDLYNTDHTPGYGSAAKFIATTMTEIARDCRVYPVKSVTIVEIMGRNAGWLTASSAIAKTLGFTAPHLIYLPEVTFDLDKFLADVKEMQQKHRTVIVAVSEGIKFANGKYVSETESTGQVDAFGHKYLAGAGKYLERFIASKLGCKVRSIELNILQRCAAHMLSATDIAEARRIGQFAVRYALAGQTGVMVAVKRVSDVPYIADIVTVPLEQVANVEKKFPLEWITPDQRGIEERFFRYVLPLISGEVIYPTENGIPKYFDFEKTFLGI
ncbi:MAG TPA: 6-phosphofructokinase [Ruminococcaceae bacterium]|nr:6-phosphofructokinase [Oscillospiraceae bacterium]